ncbi:ATP-dependent RNA helicase RhlE [Commensalibacter sp. Nvir]|uniref:DEAD/DEAH box helicase n=1 Tax=Commensalibacter sp. Nvir TaxID=3069817 RepID=UPI002D6B785C|nr:ATP-dependent RNA helicase RhlE [Commensalibacter sp. Nvir]
MPTSSKELSTEVLNFFSDLSLSQPILNAIQSMGYEKPTEIQAQAIPLILQKKDVVGIAQTGTGKTASFTLPILEILSKQRGRARMPRALILEPTRELALQVSENLKLYGQNLKLSHALLVGGESMNDQKDLLNRSVDIVIATPGRLMDLFDKGAILLNRIQILVIDEADRMLDMGFIPDVERIVSFIPKQRQTLLLSATMSKEIKAITTSFLNDPVEIFISPPSSLAETIETELIIVSEQQKKDVLIKILKKEEVKNAIIFCNRKKDVDILTRSLKKHGFSCGSLHGDLSQQIRTNTLEAFKNNKIQYLICSDIAARGLDIDNLSHVINYDLPHQAEDYVHRIGRTGRAGRLGFAYSLATKEESEIVQSIEALTQKTMKKITLDVAENQSKESEKKNKTEPNKNLERATGKKDKVIPTPLPVRVPISQPTSKENEEVIGFGQFVPAFMLSPFRKNTTM